MIKAIETRNLGKQYIISHEKEAMVRHIFPRFLNIKKYEQFWALQDINLEVDKGECVGIIGRNGAGKSTLLSILAGITFLSQGSIKINGKVSAVLSLGAGFHPELTGEENIYLNASILGMRLKDIKERFIDIVSFSELKDFIDVPLKVYSAGMYMRLGFSIAIYTDFDILLIDEIISVGDIAFQERCLNKLREFHNKGKTLVIASQSLSLLNRFCNKIILLERGKIKFLGEPKDAINRYQSLIQKWGIKEQGESEKLISVSELGYLSNKEAKQILLGWGSRDGTREVRITKVRLVDYKGEERTTFNTGENLTVIVDFIVHQEVENPHFGVAIFRKEGIYCYGPNTKFDKIKIRKLRKGNGRFSIKYFKLPLLSGEYAISVGIWENEERFAYDYYNAYYNFEIRNSNISDKGILYLCHRWKFIGQNLSKTTDREKIRENNFIIKNFIDENWQRNFNSEYLRIIEVKILNKWHRRKTIFKTNEKLILSVKFEAKKQIFRPIIWIGLFGEDKLCCYGTKIELSKIKEGKRKLLLFFSRLILLPRIHPAIFLYPRNYFLAFFIFANNNGCLKKYCCSFNKFNIIFSREDHGIVYIKHKWKLSLPK
jgi:ABC-2 type transport system ATP-binding protein/lipopolysaccharide transport system ATP-binding protein